MSLLGTLAKVAVGVAVAKGVSTMTRGGSGASGGGLGDLLGGALGGGSTGGAGTGSVFGGDRSPATTKSGGGLGELLAGRGSQSGGLGGLLESLSQASRPDDAPVAAPAGGSLGDLLNQSLQRFGEPETTPTSSQEDAARLMLRAMLQAAKCDGRIDEAEKKKLFSELGDIDREEMAFINDELAAPVDIEGLARDVPRGMGSQVYLMSLMGIDLDSKKEAEYLHQLAQALSIAPQEANAIHKRLGVPAIYR